MDEEKVREIIREEIGLVLNAMLEQAKWQMEKGDPAARSVRDLLIDMDYELPESQFELEMPF